MADLELGVDISNWSNPPDKPLLPEHVDCWKQQGRTWVCVGSQRERITRQQMTIIRDGAMGLEAYHYLYFQDDPAGQVRECLRRVAGFPITINWWDFEDSPGQLGPDEVVAWMWCALGTADAWSPCPNGLYSAPWWWPLTGDTMEFAGRLGWIADYDGIANLDGCSMGGLKIVAKQYSGSTDLCGVTVDLNVRQEAEEMSAVGNRHNAVAAWFTNRVLQPGPYGTDKDATWQVRSDFGLPAQAQAVEIELFLAGAGADDAAILLFDGGTPDGTMTGYAGQVSLKEGSHGTITVNLDDKGSCRARYLLPIKTLTVGSLRWW